MSTKEDMFRTTFIIAVFCLLGVAVGARPQTKCIEKAADVMFVLDSSTSIWNRHYREQLTFVSDLVESFGVGERISKIRIGAITFSTQSHLDFPFDRYTDLTQLKEAILNIPHRRGRTNTADALRLLKQQVQPNLKNRKVPTIAIVITDGQSMDPPATKEESRKLHELGVTVYVIGVGNSTTYDINELKAIASDPDNGVYTVSSYSELKKIRKTFYINVCEERTTSPNSRDRYSTTTELPITVVEPQNAEPGYIETDESSIILFGYDLVGMGAYRSGMIQQFIHNILPYSRYGHFGIVSYGYCPSRYNVPITSLKGNGPSIIEKSIPGVIKIPNLVDVVKQMKNIFHSRTVQNDQSGLIENQVAVLFVDSSVTTFTPELTKEIQMLKKNGVKLYIVNVGRCPGQQPNQLYSMSSQPYQRYMFRSPSYHQLLLEAQSNPLHFKPLYNQDARNSFQHRKPTLA